MQVTIKNPDGVVVGIFDNWHDAEEHEERLEREFKTWGQYTLEEWADGFQARTIYPVTPEGYVELPIHEYNPGEKSCRFCGLEPIFGSYEEYVEHFWEKEYEGPVVECDGYVWHPQPQDKELYLYLEATCTGSYIFDKHAELVG